MGPYPLERLARQATDAGSVASPADQMPDFSFHRPEQPASIVNAMGEFQAMMDTIRDGFGESEWQSEIPSRTRLNGPTT